MKKGAKSFTFYALMILVFGSLMYVVIREGESHQRVTEAVMQADAPKNLAEGFTVFLQLVSEHVHSSFGLLLLQIIVILITCRIVGVLFKKIGQPMVIGEILAGGEQQPFCLISSLSIPYVLILFRRVLLRHHFSNIMIINYNLLSTLRHLFWWRIRDSNQDFKQFIIQRIKNSFDLWGTD